MEKSDIVEAVCHYVVQHVKCEEICPGCIREAKSQSSHEHERCIMLFVRAFIRKNLPAIIDCIKASSSSSGESAQLLEETVVSPSVVAAVADRVRERSEAV